MVRSPSHLNCGSHASSDVRRERGPAELEQRAGPPDRYPDVVEELGVDVADRAREVVTHLLEEVGQLRGEQRARRRLGSATQGLAARGTTGSPVTGSSRVVTSRHARSASFW